MRVDMRAPGPRGGLQFIDDTHAAFDPLHFVLLHPRGEPGWHCDIPKGPRSEGTAYNVHTRQPVGRGARALVQQQANPAALAARFIDGAAAGGGGGDDDDESDREADGERGCHVTARQYAAYPMHDRDPAFPGPFNHSYFRDPPPLPGVAGGHVVPH